MAPEYIAKPWGKKGSKCYIRNPSMILQVGRWTCDWGGGFLVRRDYMQVCHKYPRWCRNYLRYLFMVRGDTEDDLNAIYTILFHHQANLNDLSTEVAESVEELCEDDHIKCLRLRFFNLAKEKVALFKRGGVMGSWETGNKRVWILGACTASFLVLALFFLLYYFFCKKTAGPCDGGGRKNAQKSGSVSGKSRRSTLRKSTSAKVGGRSKGVSKRSAKSIAGKIGVSGKKAASKIKGSRLSQGGSARKSGRKTCLGP